MIRYCSDSAELIRARNRIIIYKIHNITNSVCNKEELPQQRKESIIIPIYKTGDKQNIVVITEDVKLGR